MSTNAGKPPDQKRIVAALALQCHMTIDEMTPLYETERAQLALGAHIVKFLDVFTTRHILEAFRLRTGTTPASLADVAEQPDLSGA
jgi:hypothetical protein